jgi:hypothetical protein
VTETGVAMTLLAQFIGAQDIATAVTGYDANVDGIVDTTDRVAAGLRGGGAYILIASGGLPGQKAPGKVPGAVDDVPKAPTAPAAAEPAGGACKPSINGPGHTPPSQRITGPGLDDAATAAKGVVEPVVADPKLFNIVKGLYKGARTKDPIGTGSTADAIRNELRTGQPTGEKFHSIKGRENISALEKWIRRNPNASPTDQAAAQALLRDLKSALRGF